MVERLKYQYVAGSNPAVPILGQYFFGLACLKNPSYILTLSTPERWGAFVLERRMSMLKSCSYCGRIHDSKIECKQKKEAIQRRWGKRRDTKAFMFRRSNKWTDKSVQIRARDNYMCLCCRAMMDGTRKQYNIDDISVHHIVPIEEDYELRLSDDNLITVCGMHHEMCEAGKIQREEQKRLAKDSMSRYDAT